jgi:S-ribosylhomocysteine lyase LuxS involved in autoinducer biosynthesis
MTPNKLRMNKGKQKIRTDMLINIRIRFINPNNNMQFGP